ncbi:MAG: hypothetical protein ACJA2S_002605 [Cyclobacteriaceae bacterium]|jgi:hypothetical protein
MPWFLSSPTIFSVCEDTGPSETINTMISACEDTDRDEE